MGEGEKDRETEAETQRSAACLCIPNPYITLEHSALQKYVKGYITPFSIWSLRTFPRTAASFNFVVFLFQPFCAFHHLFLAAFLGLFCLQFFAPLAASGFSFLKKKYQLSLIRVVPDSLFGTALPHGYFLNFHLEPWSDV